MVLILIALIALLVLTTVMIMWAEEGNNGYAAFIGFVCAVATAVGLIVYASAGWSYIAAEYKADIINREYGTSYTQAEVYWAADVIDTVRELDRKRIELNGDLLENKQ